MFFFRKPYGFLKTINNKLTGLESLVGVPGTLGGALIMNAGAFGGEISNYLLHVDTCARVHVRESECRDLHPY